MQQLIQKAKAMGFKLEKLIYVDQNDASVPMPDNPSTAPVSAPAAPH
jgi:hypothetical protein